MPGKCPRTRVTTFLGRNPGVRRLPGAVHFEVTVQEVVSTSNQHLQISGRVGRFVTLGAGLIEDERRQTDGLGREWMLLSVVVFTRDIPFLAPYKSFGFAGSSGKIGLSSLLWRDDTVYFGCIPRTTARFPDDSL